MALILPELRDAYRRGWSLPFRGEIYEYAANLDLQNGYAIKGAFDINRSLYLKAPLKAIRDQCRREVIIVKSVQTAGSLCVDLTVPYTIEHDPGDTLWLFQSDDIAAQYMKERFLPLLRRTKSLAPWLAGRNAVQQYALLMPHMAVMMGGLNESNVQSLSKRFVYVDEGWLAGSNGFIFQARDRTTAFPYTSKFVLVSQAGNEGEDLDLCWKSSDMQEWQWQCPSCLKYQTFEWTIERDDKSWAGVKWETNDFTRPGGRWNYAEVAKTARIECFHCGHQVDDTPANRRKIDETHRFEATNPTARSTVAGFHWPFFASPDISLGDMVIAYLEAKVQQEEQSYLLPLINFYQKRLAIAWNAAAAEDYHRFPSEPYDVRSDWPKEFRRYLIADCQKDLAKFHAGVFACASDGETRELARETVGSFDEIAKVQATWNVKDQFVFLDCGYRMSDVLRACWQHGHEGWVKRNGRNVKVWFCWCGIKGSGAETFAHELFAWDKRLKRLVQIGIEQKIFSKRKWFQVSEGTSEKPLRVAYFEFSNLHCKDLARARRDGDANAPKLLILPDTLPQSDQWSYWAQTHAEKRLEKFDGRKKRAIWLPVNWPKQPPKPNHEWDKLSMLMAIQARDGIIGAPAEVEGTEQQEEEKAE